MIMKRTFPPGTVVRYAETTGAMKIDRIESYSNGMSRIAQLK